jgi:hypothetical protein
MQIVCVREGRHGYHVGDIVEIPDDVDAFDTNYFAVAVPPPAEDEAKKAKVASDLAALDDLKVDSEKPTVAKATNKE